MALETHVIRVNQQVRWGQFLLLSHYIQFVREGHPVLSNRYDRVVHCILSHPVLHLYRGYLFRHAAQGSLFLPDFPLVLLDPVHQLHQVDQVVRVTLGVPLDHDLLEICYIVNFWVFDCYLLCSSASTIFGHQKSKFFSLPKASINYLIFKPVDLTIKVIILVYTLLASYQHAS